MANPVVLLVLVVLAGPVSVVSATEAHAGRSFEGSVRLASNKGSSSKQAKRTRRRKKVTKKAVVCAEHSAAKKSKSKANPHRRASKHKKAKRQTRNAIRAEAASVRLSSTAKRRTKTKHLTKTVSKRKACVPAPHPTPPTTTIPTLSTNPAPVTPMPSPAQSPFTPETEQVTWNPLEEQFDEPDTLFLLDPTIEDTLVPGLGGLISGNAEGGTDAWQPSGGVEIVPGKFREGLQSVDRSFGYLWMPLEGYLPTDQFTVEMWLKATVPWSQVASNTPFAFVESSYDGISVNVNNGTLVLSYGQDQSLAGRVSATISYNASTIPANQWTSVAFTYEGDTLKLYVNGALVGSAANVLPPQVWSDQARSDGLSIGGAQGYGATDMAISDLRISRYARVPGQPLTVSTADTLTVSPTITTGQTVNKDLLGGLHTLGDAQTETMAQGVLTGMRTDKLLSATPIVAGAPDSTHPSEGMSGAYSYDWQVVDRTFGYYAQLDLTPYISIDSTPQILGGSVPPLSGTALTVDRSYQTDFAPQVPDNLADWSDMVEDLVYHVTVQDGYNVPYWGVWNEPDGSFWTGTLDQYLALYKATVEAVKAVNPNLQVGGPETGNWDPSWVQALIDFCATNDVPLNFISWHYYSGDLGEIAEARAEVTQWAEAAGIPVPKLIIGEWAWQDANLPGSGALPFSTTNYFINDWSASFAAESLMMMQANGITKAFYTNPVADAGETGWNGSGLMSDTGPWSNMNVFRMWSMLAPDIVSSTYTGQPGVMAQASTGSGGNVTVMLADLRYRKDVDAPVVVQLPASYAGWTVQDYVVDDQHSDAYDAGPANADLEQLPGSTVGTNGTADTLLAPRSAHLLVISPP